jgi:phosphatidylserine/phosphatidylglycerophosphate/cardiolipin synthase-like enzyme
MRKRIIQKGEKSITVNAIAGTYVVLLAMDANESARKGLLGFAIHRTDKTKNEQYWLKGFKTFEAVDPNPAPGTLVSTHEAPIQGFMWGDYTASPNNEYTYKVVPIYGSPKNLIYGTAVDIDIKTENEDNQEFAVYFNRGVAGSQAYARKFGNKSPEAAGPEAYQWLSRGLEEAILGFIGRANGKSYSIRAAAYEFSHEGVLNAFKAASQTGADVKIVYDARVNKTGPKVASEAAIKKAGLDKPGLDNKNIMIPRTSDPNFISHNKYIILLKDGVPIEVLTGSTNFTDGGIYGQSNVVHIVRDKKVAALYLQYWTKLSLDTPVKQLKPWTVQLTPTPNDTFSDGVQPIFSPRSSNDALQWYSGEIDSAKTLVGFTAAFGVNEFFANVMEKNTKNTRYVLFEKTPPGPNPKKPEKGPSKAYTHYLNYTKVHNNNIAIGEVLNKSVVGDSELHRWLGERLSGLNKMVKYLHTKYLFVDPLGDDPTLISGSANFSEGSTTSNDENMLIIKGNTMVADIYLGEFMRIWNHFYFRDIAGRFALINAKKISVNANEENEDEIIASPYLKADDSWTNDYFGDDYRKTQERVLFK